MSKHLRKERIGTVVSDRGNKTITVAVEWSQRDPIIGKASARLTKLAAHDEENSAKTGDVVRIEEWRPVSKRKRWRLVEIVQARDIAQMPEHFQATAGGTR